MTVTLATLDKQSAILNQESTNTNECSNTTPENSALCEHSMTLDHKISWTSATILKTEKDLSKRLFLEIWLNNQKSHVMNRNDGKTFPSVYQKLL